MLDFSSIRSHRVDGVEFIVLSVNDDGEGMDTDTLQQALDPFFTTKKTNEGTGLGLYVVHGLVQEGA